MTKFDCLKTMTATLAVTCGVALAAPAMAQSTSSKPVGLATGSSSAASIMQTKSAHQQKVPTLKLQSFQTKANPVTPVQPANTGLKPIPLPNTSRGNVQLGSGPGVTPTPAPQPVPGRIAANPVPQPMPARVQPTSGYVPPTIFNPYPGRVLRAVSGSANGGATMQPANGQAASLTRSSGAIGSRIGINLRSGLAAPQFLIFATGGIVPANINSGLLRDGNGFYAPVPAQLCFNNVQNWTVKLQLSDGTLIDPVGYFARPTNCP